MTVALECKPELDQLAPTGDWFIVKPIDLSERTAGGLLMPLSHTGHDKYGEVLAVGRGFYQNGVLIKPEAKVGQTIMYRAKRGLECRFSGEQVLFMVDRDLLAVIKPRQE